MIAALYVDRCGAYTAPDLTDVDAWPAARDARRYAGPHPVVAHPPCGAWAMPLAKVNRTRYGHEIGADGGMFAHALWCVRMFGGVLEHPANTAAPDARWGHGRRLWATQVAQSAYGHRCIKRTWLLACLPQQPPAIDWSEPAPTAVTSYLQRTTTNLPRLAKRVASRTPTAFRDLLLDLARRAGR